MNKKSLSPDLLRQKREQAGLSIDAVVQALAERGLSISSKTLYGYENGVGTPKVNTFVALCDIYGIHDVLDAFGYNDDWPLDLYNDFFNSSLLDKIYLLKKYGIPSFSGYEDQLDKSFPHNSDHANFSKLYQLFSSLDESHQKIALLSLEEICSGFDPVLSAHEMKILQGYRHARSGIQQSIRKLLDLPDDDTECDENFPIEGERAI